MRVSRIYYPAKLESRQVFEVDDKVHHYLSRVLRLKAGQAARFFNGEGQEFLCTMTHCSQHSSTFICQREVDALPEPKLKIKLYLAVCKNESMDFSVQKATELGVQELQPLISERSVSRTIADKRRAHWQGVARSACEQCGRAVIPKIAEPIVLREMTKMSADDLAIVCCFNAEASIKVRADKLLARASDEDAVIRLMIGPEGDFSADEVAHAIAIGFEPAHLGDYVLRCETAVAAVLSIVRSAYPEDALCK